MGNPDVVEYRMQRPEAYSSAVKRYRRYTPIWVTQAAMTPFRSHNYKPETQHDRLQFLRSDVLWCIHPATFPNVLALGKA